MALTFPSSPTTGQVFAPGPGLPTWMWDGSKWTNATTPPLHLASLSDVALATPVNGQALTYNGTSWANSNTLVGPVTLNAGTVNTLTAYGAPNYDTLNIRGAVNTATTNPAFVARFTGNSGAVAGADNGVAIVAGSVIADTAFLITDINGRSLFNLQADGSGVLGGSIVWNNTAYSLAAYAANKPAFWVQRSNGWVVNPAAPGTEVTTTGNMYFDGNNVIYKLTSSRRYKTNIRSADRDWARELVSKLRAVKFTSLCKVDDPQREHFGLIAEEVAAIDPVLATYDEDGAPQGVDYGAIGVLLLPLVQELLGMDEPEGEVYG